ncbi:glycosyltransferase [Erwinia amylovora]|uniref:Predicted glycosyl transferase, family 2 n=3 Tax=Erwinia amylovora TaxID=552 RepID=D4HUA9_ERWAC|nr:glycosyltransferase [Erwinia amylovora]CDK13714.1 putative glycosyl transferase, family 2 [Erwinia amylovora LA635]CDK17081.1 putative glycosyl transferase, family 2 [Erwinia amylovora LA636]CDK20450.1 putative glycosyl transferase, family 2 [Erwinia amylovora LA637]ATZ10059.1 glycosyl transferase [Erwinia amylovora]EKV55715.1 putative glycosyl transferase, family 2 [Erwinia amylovora ACW56400]
MLTSPPLLSVIVPFFNNEAFLIPCLESLFSQIDNDIEVILINDGSSDNSACLASQCLARYPEARVRYFSQQNSGIASTRNVGLQHASGRYITFLDGDDVLSPHYVEILKPVLFSGQYDLLDFDYHRFTDNPPEIHQEEGIRINEYGFEKKGVSCLEPLFSQSMWHLWNRVYKRELLNEERFEPGRRYEDVIFTPFIYFKSERMAHLDHTLYFYRDNSQGITRNVKPEDIEDMLFAINKMDRYAAKNTENSAIKNLAAMMIVNCFGEVKSLTKAVYGYYHYNKRTIATLQQAARICAGTSVPAKKIWQMRHPQVDMFLSKIRLFCKK